MSVAIWPVSHVRLLQDSSRARDLWASLQEMPQFGGVVGGACGTTGPEVVFAPPPLRFS